MRVIKLGGRLLEQPDGLQQLFRALQQTDEPTVLVHGGGALAQNWLTAAGFDSSKQDGLRVSPEAHMPYIVGALAGCANKMLMAQAIQAGLKPIGITLYEAGIHCEQRSKTLGQVGLCHPAEPGIINDLLAHGYLPLVSSVGFDHTGRWLNVNADDAAVAVAANQSATLSLLTDVEAVLDSQGEVISTLTTQTINTLIKQEVIHGGMLVKVRSALEAATYLRRCVRIGSWNLISHPFSGTTISE